MCVLIVSGASSGASSVLRGAREKPEGVDPVVGCTMRNPKEGSDAMAAKCADESFDGVAPPHVEVGPPIPEVVALSPRLK